MHMGRNHRQAFRYLIIAPTSRLIKMQLWPYRRKSLRVLPIRATAARSNYSNQNITTDNKQTSKRPKEKKNFFIFLFFSRTENMAEATRKLSEEELCDCLKSLNVPVRLSDIRTPTKDFMLRVCEFFCKDLQIDIMSPVLRPWSSLQYLENPEYSEEARTIFLFVLCINSFLSDAGLQIFYKDIVEPKPKKTKKILNFLVVYWSYVMNKISVYTAIDEEFLEKKQQINEMLEENQTLEDKFNNCVYELENLQPTEKEINYNMSIISNQLEEFERQQEIETNEYQDLKKQEQDLKNRLATTDVEIVSRKEKLYDLDQCILKSPEKLTDDITKIKELIKIEELKIKEREAELKEKENKLEALKLDQEENESMMRLLQQLENFYEESCEIASSVGKGFQSNKQKEDEMKKLNESMDRAQKSKSYYKDKLIKAHLELQMQTEKYRNMLQTQQNGAVVDQENLLAAKSYTFQLEQKVEKAAEEVIEIVTGFTKAESETNQSISAYKTKEEGYVTHYEKDCADIKSYIKKYFDS